MLYSVGLCATCKEILGNTTNVGTGHPVVFKVR